MSLASLSTLSALPTGIAFGALLERGAVCEPKVIRRQMDMGRTDHRMLKMFVSATATGSLVFSGLSLFGRALPAAKPLQPLANAVGGALIGIGMTVTGACPGTGLAQIGQGRGKALITVIGGVVGAGLFGKVKSFLGGLLKTYGSPTLPSLLKVPFWAVGLPFAGLLAAGLYLIERHSDWRTETPYTRREASTFQVYRNRITDDFSPYASGILMGALQIPSAVISNFALATSSVYVTAAAAVGKLFDSRLLSNPYFASHWGTTYITWQSMIDLGVIVGAFASSRLRKHYAKDKHLDDAVSTKPEKSAGERVAMFAKYFFGGMTLLFGARLANGCTSGHGISGMARLGVGSFVSVAAMFTGAIGSRKLIRHFSDDKPRKIAPPSSS